MTYKAKVLVVEDEALLQRLLRRQLADLFLEENIFIASDYSSGLKIYESQRPDVFILDGESPCNGIEFSQKIREERGSYDGVCIYTGTLVEEAEKQGIPAYLKPLEKDDMLADIEIYLQKLESERT